MVGCDILWLDVTFVTGCDIFNRVGQNVICFDQFPIENFKSFE